MFPHYNQLDTMDCGPTCLRMIAKYYGKSYTLQSLLRTGIITLIAGDFIIHQLIITTKIRTGLCKDSILFQKTNNLEYKKKYLNL